MPSMDVLGMPLDLGKPRCRCKGSAVLRPGGSHRSPEPGHMARERAGLMPVSSEEGKQSCSGGCSRADQIVQDQYKYPTEFLSCGNIETIIQLFQTPLHTLFPLIHPSPPPYLQHSCSKSLYFSQRNISLLRSLDDNNALGTSESPQTTSNPLPPTWPTQRRRPRWRPP